ncbi:hypothetical protein QQF64_023611, partial [Cirrhinus molitorella]
MSSSSNRKNQFGATSPPYIDYLKEILREYPDGGQILKELIQNADDAGASAVVFIHDERHYETHNLRTEKLGKYQGPALYAFNDAVFTEKDWVGIQRVGRSIKLDDPTKVGRFGIGFNSVYHITDFPCIFSSEHLAIFDPQKIMFGEHKEGYRWSLKNEEDRESLLNLRDQFQPFQNIVNQVNSCSWEKVISEEQYFKGTIFGFPLRNKVSEISDNLYDSTKVTQLFDSFIADADIILLFLRNVSSITLLHIDANGFCNNRLKVSVSNNFITDLSHIKQKMFDTKTCFKTVSQISQQMEEIRSQWLVTTCLLKEGNILEIDSLANKLKFYPQVDVAFQLDEGRSLCNGRLSCFLPLPNNELNTTGLPIHINACFGLTDNQRFIKWQEEDQKNDESAIWNELLTKKILPHVYLMMILGAIQLSEKSALPSHTVYNLWPDLLETVHKERWLEVAKDTLKGLFEYKIFHLADNEQIWVSASDAVFPENNIHSDTISAVSRLLKESTTTERDNLVTVPEHVLKDVQVIFPESDTLRWVTPSYVRNVLHRSEAENLSKEDKYTLLEFVLSDEKYTEIKGLKLQPLSDGTFTSFDNGVQNIVLIDNEKFPRTLLPFCKDRFLPNDLSHFCTMQLRKLATMSIYNTINLDAQHVVALMKEHLPMDWKVTQGHVTWKTADNHHPPKSWLAEFWKFLSTEWNELSSFIDMPLIPLEPLQSSGNSVILARLQSNTTLIFQSSAGSNLSDNVQKVLRMVGCTVVNRDECLRHHDIESYVLPASPRNVLQVFLNSNRDDVIKGIVSASSHEIEEFKVFLSSLDSLSIAEKDLLSMLPIFRMMSGNLGLYEPPPAEKVLENLSALRSMENPNSDFIQFTTKLHSIYKFMQDNMTNFTYLMEDTKCIPWIWNTSEFVCSGDIVLAYPPELDLSPYIKKVPEELLQYENLLTTFGVKKTLSDAEIEDILHDIKHRIDCRCPPHGASTELKVAISILDWMRKNEKILKDSTPVPVMAQNQNFTLQSLSKTKIFVFCDISAEGLDDLKQDNEELYVIHEEVLPLTAKWLKVPFLSTRILNPQFIQAEQTSIGIEQCGQYEPITQRIKNILKEYDEESDIFKEFLQNAEDAGATMCKFLLDFRKHTDPPETLFDDGMTLCNGPCLWIFNNEQFSQEDWKNIIKLGSATKENKAEMIGKFGLGFSAAYHITDIPSILSGNSLLMLDPNVTHLEKHILSKANPGIKLDLLQEQLYKRFPGQFKSYEGIFDCNLSAQNSKKAYNGTLIKLPFRTLEEANKSEICSK